MKTLALILSLVVSVSWTESPWSAEPETRPLTVKWLGTAGWEIRTGSTVILIDPFLTRKQASANEEWKTDEQEILKHIEKADFIFAGHSHADHIADIPFIAKRFGSKVIGSRTTVNIALTAGVDKSQLTSISGGGEKFYFQDFSVEVIESQHGVLNRGGRRRQPRFEEVLKPWSGPVKGDAFIEGGSYLYVLPLASCACCTRARAILSSSGSRALSRMSRFLRRIATTTGPMRLRCCGPRPS